MYSHAYFISRQVFFSLIFLYIQIFKLAGLDTNMELTLLTEDQIWGDNALDVIKKYGTKTGCSDLMTLLGGNAQWWCGYFCDNDPTYDVWTKSPCDDVSVYTVAANGSKRKGTRYESMIGTRPVLPPSETRQIYPFLERRQRLDNGEIIDICEFGEYPQDKVSRDMNEILEDKYFKEVLKETGKSYTLETNLIKKCDASFVPKAYQEYEDVSSGKKYIRLTTILSKNGISGEAWIPPDLTEWIEVKPIEWLKDPSGVWVAKRALFAGIELMRYRRGCGYNGNFQNTFLKQYLDNYFSKEMLPQQSYSASRNYQSSAKSGSQNSGGYSRENVVSHDFSSGAKQNDSFNKTNNDNNRQNMKKFNLKSSRYKICVSDTPMSVKDQIDFYVRNRMSFMLHGPSGIGKTARVEAIDPDLTAVPLWNGVLPEDIVGKVRYPDGKSSLPEENKSGGEWVAPDWYVELCKKCEAEPNKNHVLFIDEVTNARPTTQSLIFHITLKKSISPSKGKLPDNSVVVLAGNSKDESGAAYNMPEPLFRRMCGHIYLKPDIQDWLEWGSEKSRKHPEDPERLNIHPLVSSFVATYGQKVFYSSYDEEDPKQWAIDPRGWEQVSDIIYDNKGYIRRELLESKMGPELAYNMMAYAKNPPLSLEDVVNGEYSNEDIPYGHDARLALTLSLRHADGRQIGKVKQFIRKYLGSENEAIFDSLWIGENDEKALQIAQQNQLRNVGR